MLQEQRTREIDAVCHDKWGQSIMTVNYDFESSPSCCCLPGHRNIIYDVMVLIILYLICHLGMLIELLSQCDYIDGSLLSYCQVRDMCSSSDF